MALNRRIFSIVATPVLAAAPAVAQEPRTGAFEQYFGSVSVALGEGARINLVNPMVADSPDPNCETLIAILDTSGAVLRRSTVSVPVGKTHSVDFQPTGIKVGQRVQLRAVVHSINPPEPDVPTPCRVLATLEVYNVVSGRTMFAIGPALAINPPEPDINPPEPD